MPETNRTLYGVPRLLVTVLLPIQRGDADRVIDSEAEVDRRHRAHVDDGGGDVESGGRDGRTRAGGSQSKHGHGKMAG
ncbi:MAG: hypothetical protein ACT4PZ_07660 [Panacagrimonas sp.]